MPSPRKPLSANVVSARSLRLSSMTPAEWLEDKLDQNFSAETRARVVSDFETWLKKDLDATPDGMFGPSFQAAFGGPGVRDVFRYLDERVAHVFALDAKVELVLRQGGAEIRSIQIDRPDESGAVATSFGRGLWFASLLHPVTENFLRFNGKEYPIASTRIGALRLGPAYFHPPKSQPRLTAIARLSTWVHEARHSDCGQALTPDDVEQIRDKKGPRVAPKCGYPHAVCPAEIVHADGSRERHPYAGIPACDSTPWGPYMLQAVYASVMRDDCRNCSELERQEAKAIALDALTRLQGGLDEKLVRGELGQPDMDSYGLVTERQP